MDDLDLAYNTLVGEKKDTDLDEAYEALLSPEEKRYYETPGALESFVLGAQKGAAMGFSGEAAKAGTMMAMSGPASLSPSYPKELTQLKEDKGYELAQKAKEDLLLKEKEASQNHPWAYGSGNIAGGMASSPMLPFSAPGGAVAGYGYSESDTIPGKLVDAGIGTILGHTGGQFVKDIGAGAEVVLKPALNKAASKVSGFFTKKGREAKVDALRPPPTYKEKLKDQGQLEKAGQLLEVENISGVTKTANQTVENFDAAKERIGTEIKDIVDEVSNQEIEIPKINVKEESLKYPLEPETKTVGYKRIYQEEVPTNDSMISDWNVPSKNITREENIILPYTTKGEGVANYKRLSPTGETIKVKQPYQTDGSEISEELQPILSKYQNSNFQDKREMAEYIKNQYGNYMDPKKSFSINQIDADKTELGKKIGKDNWIKADRGEYIPPKIQADINMYHYLKAKADKMIEGAASVVESAGMTDKVARWRELIAKYRTLKSLEPTIDRYASRTSREAEVFLKDIGMAGVGASLVEGNLPKAGMAFLFGGGSKMLRSFGRDVKANTYSMLGKTLKGNPAALGAYAEPLTQAAMRSEQALGAAHYTLWGQDQNYRKMLEQLADQDGERDLSSEGQR